MAVAELRHQAEGGDLGRDVAIVGTISAAHFCSHFYQFTLPLLFPRIQAEYGVGFTELGLLVTVFYASSGFAQTAAGFLVDHVGPARVLAAGLGLLAASMALVALVPSFWMIYPAAALAGLGNSVFHPADYSILTSSVRKEWMARAYGIHQLGGNLGWAVAPAAVLTLSHFFGWHTALVILGLCGYVLLAIVWWQGSALSVGDAGSARARVAAGPRTAPLQMLMAPAILLCFSYFAMLSMALTGFQSFLPAALNTAHGTPLVIAGWALTGYLVGGAAGILFGGWLADHSRRHERILAYGLFAAAVLVMVVGLADLQVGLLILVISAAGFCSGMTSPSRDMMVRSATPPGATGKVFGFVYSGLDLGSAFVPPLLGLFLDQGVPIGVFAVTAVALAVCIVLAYALQRAGTAQSALAVRPAE
jgi:MFS transporter, FSR family, fosmidomycin resistance protein